METTTKNNAENKVQNVEIKEIKETLSNTTMNGEERKQKVSASYTVRAFAENAKKLSDLNLITTKEYEQIKAIHKEATIMYMQKELGVMMD